jgi:hypothetical protein
MSASRPPPSSSSHKLAVIHECVAKRTLPRLRALRGELIDRLASVHQRMSTARLATRSMMEFVDIGDQNPEVRNLLMMKGVRPDPKWVRLDGQKFVYVADCTNRRRLRRD